jgi:ribosomal protein S18 acetylase RimI-like enzyme
VVDDGLCVRIEVADLTDPAQGDAVVELIDGYARGPGGQNAPLTDTARAGLVAGLHAHPRMKAYLACDGDQPVGVAVCIEGFSTFAGKPSVNIHDLAVAPKHQGRGIGGALIDRVVADARAAGCCKVTLEVHDGNTGAKHLYRRKGFGPWDPATLFVTKPL